MYLPDEELQQIDEQENKLKQQFKHRIHVCLGASCLNAHSAEVKAALEAQVLMGGMEKTCAITGGGCRGLCAEGPTVTLEHENVLYGKVEPADAADIISNLGKEPVERLNRPDRKSVV